MKVSVGMPLQQKFSMLGDHLLPVILGKQDSDSLCNHLEIDLVITDSA